MGSNDGSEVGADDGLVLEAVKEVGLIDRVSLGASDAMVGFEIGVPEGFADDLIVGRLVGMTEGFTLGTVTVFKLGVELEKNDGELLGVADASVLGRWDGNDVWLGVYEGVGGGTIDGKSVGITECWSLGSFDGILNGIKVG